MITLNDLPMIAGLAIEHVFEYIKEEFEDDLDFTIEDLPCLDIEYDRERFGISFSLVQDDAWTNDGKCESKDVIHSVHLIKEGVIYDTDRYIKQTLVRSGSYYDDYEYFNEMPIEVERKTRVIEEVYYEEVNKDDSNKE